MININQYLSTSLITGGRRTTLHSKVSLPNLKPLSNVINLSNWRKNNVQQTITKIN